MPRVFDQFHFSLIERDQADLLEPSLSREEWLRLKLGQPFEFAHRGKGLHWVPQHYSDEFIIGVVERKRLQAQRRPPHEGAAEFEGETWQGALVVVDPVHRPDGQKVGFEDSVLVGQPKAILDSLVSKLNENAAHQYALHFKPLFRGDSFWKFAEKHGGSLQYVAFKFTVPNMIFGAGTGVTTGLKRIGNDTGAQEVEVRLESDDGVKANSQSVRESVEYAEDGNARVTAKSQSGEYWSSTKQKMTAKLDAAIDFTKASSLEVKNWLRRALDRGTDSVNPDVYNSDSSPV